MNENLPGDNGEFPSVKLPPEFLERLRQQINEEEILAAIREVERTGGLELRDFLHELEEIVGPDE